MVDEKGALNIEAFFYIDVWQLHGELLEVRSWCVYVPLLPSADSHKEIGAQVSIS